jgi:hypothetical protein
MKTIAFAALFGIALLSQSACTPGKQPADGPVAPSDSNTVYVTPSDGTCRAIDKNEPQHTDNLLSMEGHIEGDCLILTVSYGGGCADHDFALHWNGIVLESAPPQVHMRLSHKDGDDRCKAIKTEELRFDLATVKAYGGDQIELGIFAEGVQAVGLSYKF